MSDENKTDASDDKSELSVDEQKEKELQSNLYDETMGKDEEPGDSDDKGGADDKKTDEGKKPDDGGEEKKDVEDDDLLGINDDEKGDDESADEADDSDSEDSDDENGDDVDDKSKPPEDYKLQLDKESLLGSDAVKHAEEYAKKHGLTQEAAEAHLQAKEDAVKEYQEFLDREAPARAEEAVKEHKATWLADAKKDEDIGGDNFNETVARANRYLKTYGDKETFEVFKASGMGNHKVVLKLLSKGAQHLMDDNIDTDTEVEDDEVGFLDEMYPSMK